jgi:hypothetical protein
VELNYLREEMRTRNIGSVSTAKSLSYTTAKENTARGVLYTR